MAETLRDQLDALRIQLRNERSTWKDYWQDLAQFILPRRERFFDKKPNQGDRRNLSIIDSTATQGQRILTAGMMSGITSPSRPWFKLAHPTPEINEKQSVKVWLSGVTRTMREVMSGSNFYNSMNTMYGDLSVFSTAPIGVFEDDDDVIHCETYPIGGYAISTDRRGRVNVLMREFDMTVRQVVERFGKGNVSATVMHMWDKGQLEAWVEVVHIVRPNPDGKVNAGMAGDKPFQSIFYETATNNKDDKFLRVSGFDEFPFFVPRWDVAGQDIYGSGSPGMTALGDIKALQLLQKSKSRLVEKLADPPMIAPVSMKNQAANMLPGGITYMDVRDPSGLRFSPAHEVNPQGLVAVASEIIEHQNRINTAFFRDLFLMIASDDKTNRTATEIAIRQEEKMLMLGPILERLNSELLDPLIDRVFNIMARRGMLPPIPPELEGVVLEVEYISITAQAQKSMGVANLERFAGFVGSQMAAQPDIGDKYDFDQSVDEYADAIGVPPTVVRSDEDVEFIRRRRAEALAAQQQAELIEQNARGAKLLSETNVTEESALTNVAGALAGAA